MMGSFTKRVKLSMKGLYILFRKRRCPYCSQKLIRKDKNELLKTGWMRNPFDLVGELNFHFGKHYKKNITYYCSVCNKIFS
jgi:DNA-directed RNA polymerase subunit RPC12/RpoP